MSLCEILLDVWEAVPDQESNIDKIEWPQSPYTKHFSLEDGIKTGRDFIIRFLYQAYKFKPESCYSGQQCDPWATGLFTGFLS